MPTLTNTTNKILVRCSSLDRLISCPGSRTLEAKLNDVMDFSFEPDGDEMTWRGNWCHYESARRLVRDHGAIAPDGLYVPVLPLTWKPQPWDERTVDWYVAAVMADTPADHAIFVEQRFTMEFPRFILSGQLDVYSINFDATEFTIDDNKTGPNEVDRAEENWQLAGYGALLKRAIPTLTKGKMRIRQRAAENQTTEVEIDELDLLVEYLEKKINAALDAWLTVETGYKACRLCPCIEFCPALDAEITAMKLLLTQEQVDALKVTNDRRQLAEVAARGRAIAGPIDRLLAALKERVLFEGPVVLADGTEVRVVEEEGRRSVTAPKVAHAFVAQKIAEVGSLHTDDADDLAWRALSMSVTEVEDILVELGMQRKSTKAEKETAQSWNHKTLGHLITRPRIKKLKFS